MTSALDEKVETVTFVGQVEIVYEDGVMGNRLYMRQFKPDETWTEWKRIKRVNSNPEIQ